MGWDGRLLRRLSPARGGHWGAAEAELEALAGGEQHVCFSLDYLFVVSWTVPFDYAKRSSFLFCSFPAVVPGQLSIGNLKYIKNKIHSITSIIKAGLSKRGNRQTIAQTYCTQFEQEETILFLLKLCAIYLCDCLFIWLMERDCYGSIYVAKFKWQCKLQLHYAFDNSLCNFIM